MTLKERYISRGRCPVCTLPVPCKHLTGDEEIFKINKQQKLSNESKGSKEAIENTKVIPYFGKKQLNN